MNKFPRMLITALCVGGLALIHAPYAYAAMFAVNTTDDIDDGICNVAHCSLREAINAANLNPGSDVIQFNIPGAGPHTIRPTSALPAISDNILVDATTEPGYIEHPMIEIEGSLAGPVNGLEMDGDGNVVRGLAINRFVSGVSVNGSSNRLEGNFIGTDVLGLSDFGNLQSGIVVIGANNVIGGLSDAARGAPCLLPCNLISGNTASGISILSANNTVVHGNMIGTDVFGTYKISNDFNGIGINTGSNNVIGHLSSGNVISGNGSTGGSGGVVITSGMGNIVEGNRIGTNGAGTMSIPNYAYGIFLHDTDHAAIRRNLISGNEVCGVFADPGSTRMLIQGNLIGTDAGGTIAIPNVSCGVGASGESGGLIGGTEAWQGNLIMGNSGPGAGISIASAGPLRGDWTTIQGNNIDGNYVGIHIFHTQYVQIGGAAPGARNIIINNRGGINLGGPVGYAIIEGNWIGVAADGSAAGNWNYGVFVTGTKNTVADNVIANNSGPGIHVLGTATTVTHGNRLLGNSIYGNTGPGIDLSLVSPGWDGVTPNDSGDIDDGPNRLQNFPVLASAESDGAVTTVTGTFGSISDRNYRLEFFANTSCDVIGHGEGERYLGFANVYVGAAGSTPFTATGLLPVAPGEVITSTATELAEFDTSEFSACFTATASPSLISSELVSLMRDIDALRASGALLPGSAKSLNATLKTAIGLVGQKKYEPAIKQMLNFDRKVRLIADRGDLDPKLSLSLLEQSRQIVILMQQAQPPGK